MACILSLETATKTCSCALIEEGQLLGNVEFHLDHSHSTILHPSIEYLIKSANKSMNDLSAVAVSKGPGSYTGLRIGVSTAKGICDSLNIPLISVSTLQGLASKVLYWNDRKYKIVPWLDARRSEVYGAVYSHDLNMLQTPEPIVVTRDYLHEFVKEEPMILLGNGADKFETWLQDEPNAIWVRGQTLSAIEIAFLGEQKWQNQQFEDNAVFEPFYLKKFKAGITQKTKV